MVSHHKARTKHRSSLFWATGASHPSGLDMQGGLHGEAFREASSEDGEAELLAGEKGGYPVLD